jgi:hypothetical protein
VDIETELKDLRQLVQKLKLENEQLKLEIVKRDKNTLVPQDVFSHDEIQGELK